MRAMLQRNWRPAAETVPWNLALIAIYLLLAIAATWPLAARMGAALPRGREPVATVPLFNAWTIWWNCHCASTSYAKYWDAPIFHPVANTFAFSEPMPLTGLARPLWAATGNLAIVYNTLLLAALAVNGWGGFHLARRSGVDPWVALVGGAMVVTLPFVFNELGVFQLAPLAGIIAVLVCLDRFAQQPSLVWGGLLGASFTLTYHLCTYYALFLLPVLPIPAIWLLGKKLISAKAWGYLVVGGISAGVLVAPSLAAQMRVGREYDVKRPESLLRDLSADLTAYVASPWKPSFYPDPVGEEEGHFHIRLLPGGIKYALAAVGAVFGLWTRERRRWTLFLLLLAAVAFPLSLGLNLRIGEWSPYELLIDWVPGFAQARNVFRFAVFVQLALVMLSLLGLQAIAAWGEHARRPARWKVGGAHALAALLAVAAVAELWPPEQTLSPLPSREKNERWLTWLRENTLPQSPVACIPFPQGRSVEDYESTAVWMYWGAEHHRPMVNGYSGFFPPEFIRLKETMQTFPDAASVEALAQLGVEYCIVAWEEVPPQAFQNPFGVAPRLEHVFADDQAQIGIYRVRPPANPG
jgi:hypothetical protein